MGGGGGGKEREGQGGRVEGRQGGRERDIDRGRERGRETETDRQTHSETETESTQTDRQTDKADRDRGQTITDSPQKQLTAKVLKERVQNRVTSTTSARVDLKPDLVAFVLLFSPKPVTKLPVYIY